MVKQIAVHEIAIALIVGGFQTDVLVQIDGVHTGEVQTFLTAAARELLIHADRARTGGEAQRAVGLLADNRLDNIGSGRTLGGVVFGNDYFH